MTSTSCTERCGRSRCRPRRTRRNQTSGCFGLRNPLVGRGNTVRRRDVSPCSGTRKTYHGRPFRRVSHTRTGPGSGWGTGPPPLSSHSHSVVIVLTGCTTGEIPVTGYDSSNSPSSTSRSSTTSLNGSLTPAFCGENRSRDGPDTKESDRYVVNPPGRVLDRRGNPRSVVLWVQCHPCYCRVSSPVLGPVNPSPDRTQPPSSTSGWWLDEENVPLALVVGTERRDRRARLRVRVVPDDGRPPPVR